MFEFLVDRRFHLRRRLGQFDDIADLGGHAGVADDGFADACGTCNATCDGAGSGSTCGDGAQCPEIEDCDDGFTDACGSCNATCSGAGTGADCGTGLGCNTGATDCATGTCTSDMCT